jgi:hypothetical protein
MSKAPPRWKQIEDYTPAEHVERLAAERRGETFRVETAEYRDHRRRVLRAGGLDDEADDDEGRSPDEMTVEGHVKRLHENAHIPRRVA